MADQSQSDETDRDFVEVAKCGRAHGVKGEVRVFTDDPNWEGFEAGTRLYAEGGVGPRRAVTIERWRIASEFVIAKFEEVEGRNEAEKLTNRILTIPDDELPELGDEEFYHYDLEGLAVRVRPGGEDEPRRIGVVDGIFETGANDVLVVDLDDGDDLYVPMFEGAVEPIEPDDDMVYLRPLEEWAPKETDI